MRNTLYQLMLSPSFSSFLVRKYPLSTYGMRCTFLLLETLLLTRQMRSPLSGVYVKEDEGNK